MDVEKIDTRQGTKNSFALSHGNCLPLTGLPFGANYFAVETGSGAWWFDPDAEHYHGFRLTHQATVWGGPEGDYCSLGLLPFSTPNRGIIDVPFEPAESAFHPDRLTIRQANADLTTTLVPTMYGAALETTSGFADLGLIISFPSTGALTRVDGQVIEGYTLQRHALAGHTAKQYFHLEASRSVEQRTTLPNGQEMLDFAPASEALTLRLGTSYISPEFAVRNMPTASLTALAQAARKAWQEKLVKVEVTSRNQDQVKTFYHMMYRAFLFPERMYELDENGQPVHRDLYANQVRPGFLYTGTGTWDMARTTYPLYSLIETDEYEQILSGFLNSYRESGYLPKWLNPQDNGGMSGNLIEAVIADAAVKAVAKDKMPAFLDALLAGAEQQDPQGMRGRRYADDYRKLGYIPGNIRESVNNTLDYSYGDFCISVVAKIVGNSEVYDQYRPGGLNYRQLFSKKAGFMVAKEPDGQFRQDFKDTSWTRDYTEGSAWQSTFAVPHDIQGLINLYGGNQPFLAVLSRLANSQPTYDAGPRDHITHEMTEMSKNQFGQINIGDQPSFHLPYLFHFVGKPYYAQPLLKQLMTRLFSAGVKGYPGDEDNGSMSAWYIFNALGLYPFCPGTGEYLIGIPLFDEAKVHLSNGQTVRITASSNHPQQQFVDSLTRDGKPFKTSFITHDQLLQTNQLQFALGTVPNPFCFDDTKRPFSLSQPEE